MFGGLASPVLDTKLVASSYAHYKWEGHPKRERVWGQIGFIYPVTGKHKLRETALYSLLSTATCTFVVTSSLERLFFVDVHVGQLQKGPCFKNGFVLC